MMKNLAVRITAALVLGAAMYAPQSVDAANVSSGSAAIGNTPVVSNRPTRSADSTHRMTVKEKAAQIAAKRAEQAKSNANTSNSASVVNSSTTATNKVTQAKANASNTVQKQTTQAKTNSNVTVQKQGTEAKTSTANTVQKQIEQAKTSATASTRQAVTQKSTAANQSVAQKVASSKQQTADTTSKTLSKAEQKKAKEAAKAKEKAEKDAKKHKLKDTSKSKSSSGNSTAMTPQSSGWRNKVAQKNLKTLGYSSEAPNGKLTDTTKKALERFQKDQGLKTTGELDDATYKKLNWKAFEKTGISNVQGSDVVANASKYKGVPYVFGGTTPKGFDCSGYVQHVFKNMKANLPRLADAQALEGIYVNQSQLKPGDLVFFSTYEPGASHVGIYAGNNQFWNATSSRGVMLSSLKEDYWRTRYYGARRVLVKNGEIK